MNFRIGIALALLAFGSVLMAFNFERPPVEVKQTGYRGLGMEEVTNLRAYANEKRLNALPARIDPVAPGGPLATTQYKNVKVLTDLSVDEFNRLMQAMTEWVSPAQGCGYCHGESGDFASDAPYQKIVARRMLEMTRHINADWKNHVGATGVTCYTCHRGNPVPANIWFDNPPRERAGGMAANPDGQNIAGASVGLTSLPYDPFQAFLTSTDYSIRVVSKTALPNGNQSSIKKTEWTYGLMMHMSQSLGVNCTFCHNSRSFMGWDQSTPQRNTAYQGLQLVRNLNKGYLVPLKASLPQTRLGPDGDAPKLNCGTCHQGVNKPLFGASMLKDFPELGKK